MCQVGKSRCWESHGEAVARHVYDFSICWSHYWGCGHRFHDRAGSFPEEAGTTAPWNLEQANSPPFDMARISTRQIVRGTVTLQNVMLMGVT